MAADTQTQNWSLSRRAPPSHDGAEIAQSGTKELHEEPARYPPSHSLHETRLSTTLTSESPGAADQRGNSYRAPSETISRQSIPAPARPSPTGTARRAGAEV